MSYRQICSLMCILFLSGLSLGQQAVQKGASPRAKWNPNLEAYGLSKSLFDGSHLSRLSEADLKTVLAATFSAGVSSGMRSAKPVCGAQGKNVDLSTVKLYLVIPNDIDVEEASAIRARLRTFPDVRVVFPESEADASIYFLGFHMYTRERHLPTGFTLAYYASRLCSIDSGSNSAPALPTVIYFDLETDGTLEPLIQSVAANIDSNVNEKIRRWNAVALTEKSK